MSSSGNRTIKESSWLCIQQLQATISVYMFVSAGAQAQARLFVQDVELVKDDLAVIHQQVLGLFLCVCVCVGDSHQPAFLFLFVMVASCRCPRRNWHTCRRQVVQYKTYDVLHGIESAVCVCVRACVRRRLFQQGIINEMSDRD